MDKSMVYRLKAYELVLAERKQQIAKFGHQQHAASFWLTILMEEVGEVAQAILQTQFGGPHAGTVKEELVQVTAVCFAWLEAIFEQEENEENGDQG